MMEFKDEAAFSVALQQTLEFAGCIVEAHEDKFRNFIPDLSFAYERKDGWLEVKWCNRDPVRLSGIEHYTAGQRDWLRRRGARGAGHCYLVVGTPKRVIVWSWQVLDRVHDMIFDRAIYDASFLSGNMVDLAADFIKHMGSPGPSQRR